ncbi:MAG: ATP-binding protein [Selenomonadaceae bacterium]|nr:ATP-binding protein [Selenomonadaceae bacterium]
MRLKRESYLAKIRPYYDIDLIKVITGIRRAGKSILMETIRDELTERGVKGDHIIYMNLEEMDYDYISNARDLHEDVKTRVRDGERYYVFLDEVQHVKDFEKALASFRASMNVSLFVTGSNSTLLSGELASLLTGRTVEFEVLPFSFSEMKEYYELNNRPFEDDMIYDYLKWGGFPLRFEFGDEANTMRYIKGLYDSIVTRDIVPKNSRIDRAVFKAISLYILANAGKEFSGENIAAYYNKNSEKSVSARTIYNYLDKMKKAFLLHSVGQYHLSGKASLKGREKYYATDMGLRTINTNTMSYEDTFFLENVVYNELLCQGFTVFTGKTYKSEVDFVAVKDGKKCFIQVSYLLASEDTIRREFEAFSPITDASPKYVISLDKVDMSRQGITHLNVTDFLLHRKELMLS